MERGIDFQKIWRIAKRLTKDETTQKIIEIASKTGFVLDGMEAVFFLAVQLIDQVKALKPFDGSDFQSRAFDPELDKIVARGLKAYVEEN